MKDIEAPTRSVKEKGWSRHDETLASGMEYRHDVSKRASRNSSSLSSTPKGPTQNTHCGRNIADASDCATSTCLDSTRPTFSLAPGQERQRQAFNAYAKESTG